MKSKIIYFIAIFICFSMFATLVSLPVSVAADTSMYHATGMQMYKFGIKANIVTRKVYLANNDTACAAFVAYVSKENDTWAQTGYYQGITPYHDHFYSSPRYYYEYMLYGNYHFHDLGSAYVGQTHQYGVYIITQTSAQYGSMIMYRDNLILANIYGFPKEESYYVAGEGESHNFYNTMNYEFLNVSYATQGLYWYPFYNTKFTADFPPYMNVEYSDTHWMAVRR